MTETTQTQELKLAGNKITVAWDDQDPNNEGWAFWAVLVDGHHESGGLDSSDFEGAVTEAEAQLEALVVGRFGTARQIRILGDEAASAGDSAQVALCEAALEGDEAAELACALVISEAAGA